MSDADATRGRRNVADPLRKFAQMMRKYHGTNVHGDERDYVTVTTREMLEIANQIDREHARRMRQQSYDLRRAFCRYLGSVIDDYKRGIKRKRLRK